MRYALKDLIDIPKLQSLLDTLDAIYSLPSAIIDSEGNILTATAWQDICTRFHRVNPETEKRCKESDSHIAEELGKNPAHVIYECPLGLVDTATPIIVEGHHLGNVFTGQLFTEQPDESRFIRQARQYGFHERDYLEALKRVPIISEERLRKNLEFLGRFTEMLAAQGLLHKRQLELEDALRSSENRYKAIVENQAEFVVRYIQGGIVTFINDTLCNYVNMKREDLLGKTYYPFMYEADRAAFIRQVESISADTPTIDVEARVALPDGRIAWHKWTHSAIFDKEGTIIEYQATGRDVTSSKAIEEALRTSEARFRTIIENASAGIMVADIETTRILYANPEICRMLGYSEQELCARTVNDVAAQEEAQESLAAFKAHAAGKLRSSERTFRRKDGSSVRVGITSVSMEIDSRRCLVGFFTDITEKLLLEEERLKTQKLEAIGTLAGGIAHDFNNLLQGVFGYISLAKLVKDDAKKRSDALEEAEKALHQSVSLTAQLLTFSKGGKPIKKVFDLRPIIENSVKFALSGSRAEYVLSVDDELHAVEADEGQIAQVLQNIVLNGDQAMPMGGRIEVSARNIRASAEGSSPLSPPGDFVEITIRDQGLGIPTAHLTKIFDPYFTTKEKGSGLGLATAYSIIRNHGGTITVSSELGKGSTFTVCLPASAHKMESPSTAETPKGEKLGRILVMDDEEVVRKVAGELIATLGHQVELAGHGDEAVAAYLKARDSGNPFDAVILDMTIRGGVGGIETVKRLREIDPDVKAIVSSGYSEDAALSEYERLGFVGALKKPYTIEGLCNNLNRVLK